MPRLVRFSGVAADSDGKPASGTIGITFAVYSQQSSGPALWMETQNVAVDATGHYSVMLGATQPEGLPVDLFDSGDAHWLGVQISGEPEQPRVLLVSVPYALKAGDAATIGGLPPSAFVLANQSQPTTGAQRAPASTLAPHANASTAIGNVSNPDVTGSGTASFIPLWDASTDIVNSILFQSGSGSSAVVGINTTAPGATLDVNGTINSASGFKLKGALFLQNFGINNTFVGASSGNTTLTGAFNTTVGNLALNAVTFGDDNSAFGSGSLALNTGGGFNSAFGGSSLGSNSTGGTTLRSAIERSSAIRPADQTLRSEPMRSPDSRWELQTLLLVLKRASISKLVKATTSTLAT